MNANIFYSISKAVTLQKSALLLPFYRFYVRKQPLDASEAPLSSSLAFGQHLTTKSTKTT